MTRAQFEEVVAEALDSLPPRFAELLRNVAVTVEDEPLDDDYDAFDDWEDGEELLGIYRGVPLTDRGGDEPLLPDEVVIFRGPITRVTDSREEMLEEIRETVIHEIGHHFGLEDDELP